MGMVRWNYETAANGPRRKTGLEVLAPINQADFQPLIDSETFQEAQRILKERKITAFRSDNFYPFSGVAKCARCGYGMTGAFKPKNNYRYYKCRGRISFGVCDMPLISEEALEREFLKALELAEIDIEMEAPEQSMTREEIEKQKARLEQKRKRAKELYLEGDINRDEYDRLMENIKNEEVALQQAETGLIDMQTIEAAKELLKNIKKEWPHFSNEAKKQAINSIFKSITVQYVSGIGRRQKLEIVDYELK